MDQTDLEAFHLFLSALDYPQLKTFDVYNDDMYKELVLWLENTKIRRYPIDQRSHLAVSQDNAQWTPSLEGYLDDLGCPVTWKNGTNRHAVLQWLLIHAVNLQYSDQAEECNTVIDRAVASIPEVGTWVPPPLPPFPDLDTPETQAAMRQIMGMLGLETPVGSADRVVIEKDVHRAIAVLETELLPVAEWSQELADKAENVKALTPSQILSSMVPLGFATGDDEIDLVSRVVRLSHLKDLRNLQTEVDDVLTSVQELTANPKTNVASGKVGK